MVSQVNSYPKEGGEYILAFDVEPDGTVKNRRNFAKYEIVTQRPNGTPDVRFGGDGLAIDGQDRVYAATAAGIQVFSPQGKHLGTIPVSRNPNNLAFAGPDKKTLYIVARLFDATRSSISQVENVRCRRQARACRSIL